MIVGIALLVGGCQQDGNLRVEQTGGRLEFAMTRTDGQGACIDDLSVYSGEPEGEPLWHVAAGSGAACTARIRFGMVPAGFAADDGQTAVLRRTGRYTVVASGKGFLDSATFVAPR